MSFFETAQDKAELCEDMRDVFAEKGHCHGTYKNMEGQVCLMGAALEVANKKNMLDAFTYISADRDVVALGIWGTPTGEFANEVANILGFKEATQVYQTNDGYTKFAVQRSPAESAVKGWVWNSEWDEVAPSEEIEVEVKETYVPGLTQETVMDFVMKRAKYWREQG